MKKLVEIRSITKSHEALVAMEDIAAHFNIAFDDALGDWANRSGKHVIDCDNQDAIDNNAPLVFGWDNDNEAACHAMDLIKFINDNRDGDEFLENL